MQIGMLIGPPLMEKCRAVEALASALSAASHLPRHEDDKVRWNSDCDCILSALANACDELVHPTIVTIDRATLEASDTARAGVASTGERR